MTFQCKAFDHLAFGKLKLSAVLKKLPNSAIAKKYAWRR